MAMVCHCPLSFKNNLLMKSIKKIFPQDLSAGKKGPPISARDPAGETNVSLKTLQDFADLRKSPSESSAFKSMESLAGAIIHEIRNPLTAISLANQSLLDEIQYGDVPASLNPLTTIISKNISRIECLLKDLLYINSSRDLELKPTDISDVIEDCLEKAGDRIYLKKIDVIKSYSTGILIDANAEKLSMAFLNIIVNSIEAVAKHEGKIWITVYRIKDEVRVVFKDNGIGMQPDVATHMFEKNFSGKTKGLGVGLSHVKEILEKHRASISVTSEPEIGTLIVIGFKTI
jgi:signal transduction histidine kinase